MNSPSHRRIAGLAARCAGALTVVWLILAVNAQAFQRQAAAQTGPTKSGRVSLDRVVAVVNGDLILQSDVDEEERFSAFQPFSEPASLTKDALINRLIDRDLILQQLSLQPEAAIPDAQVDEQLASLRKSIPACAAYHCNTAEGWQKFIAAQGFTLAELRARWKVRMEVLQFIEERFRMGIRIEPDKIDEYYRNTMIPAYQKEKVSPPTEASISDRIQEVLLQQQVTELLDDWLKALRAQGSVRIVKSGEAMP